MTAGERPVVLVHGWKSHPGIWDRLVAEVSGLPVTFWRFDHSRMKGADLAAIARSLRDFIGRERERSGYRGPMDIVCHSMGTGIARFLLEVIARKEEVCQVIGLGPPQRGSSLAELFFDPVHSPRVLRDLSGIFVPRRFDPSRDTIVQEFRPMSRAMVTLRSAGLRDDVSYRCILTENVTADPAFFPPLAGKTYVMGNGSWETTYAGDGIVPHADSFLPGAGFDVLPRDPSSLHGSPDHYCHLHLPANPEVIHRVKDYLISPETRPQHFWPD
ncbi:MAG: acetyltransferase [Methanolinea sp.]|nr:acetyltransferase [Methanolinea sp.]